MGLDLPTLPALANNAVALRHFMDDRDHSWGTLVSDTDKPEPEDVLTAIVFPTDHVSTMAAAAAVNAGCRYELNEP